MVFRSGAPRRSPVTISQSITSVLETARQADPSHLRILYWLASICKEGAAWLCRRYIFDVDMNAHWLIDPTNTFRVHIRVHIRVRSLPNRIVVLGHRQRTGPNNRGHPSSHFCVGVSVRRTHFYINSDQDPEINAGLAGRSQSLATKVVTVNMTAAVRPCTCDIGYSYTGAG